MDSEKEVKFSLRVDRDIFDKFRYVADYDARSLNKQLVYLIKKNIAEFEKEHGTITDKMLTENAKK